MQPGTDVSSSSGQVRYLGEEGPDTPLVAAISMCNPFDLVSNALLWCCSLLRRKLAVRWRTNVLMAAGYVGRQFSEGVQQARALPLILPQAAQASRASIHKPGKA
jgi:predicted alpha/beta-fold hydrolase